MTRYELKYAVQHPARWLAIWWVHVTLTVVLTGMAIAWTADIFSPVLRPNLWPIGMGAVAIARREAAHMIRRNPSLTNDRDDLIQEALLAIWLLEARILPR